MLEKVKLIEAILFWKGEPVSQKKLAELSTLSSEEVKEAIQSLKDSLKDRGIVLIEKDNEVMLGTAPEAGEIIERLTREELSKELSKAALETLSIILYMAPIRRSAIDYIRGVNSQFSVRHLEIRGLVEKIPDERDNRVYLYRPTFDLLSHLGATSTDSLPQFGDVKAKLAELEREQSESEDREQKQKDESET